MRARIQGLWSLSFEGFRFGGLRVQDLGGLVFGIKGFGLIVTNKHWPCSRFRYLVSARFIGL